MRLSKSEVEILLTLAKDNEWTPRSIIVAKGNFSQARTKSSKYLNSLEEKGLITVKRVINKKTRQKYGLKQWKIRQDARSFWIARQAIKLFIINQAGKSLKYGRYNKIEDEFLKKFDMSKYAIIQRNKALSELNEEEDEVFARDKASIEIAKIMLNQTFYKQEEG